MATTGTMTAAVWMAPMVAKLPLPIAQRVQRLLEAKPGVDTQAQALALCEAIVAYAACIRASVAAAVVPAGRRATLAAGVAAFRDVVERGDASISSFRDLLLAGADAIEEIEPGHPLGRSELTRPRTAWVARMQLVEALGDEFGEALTGRVVDGGIAGIIDLWVALIEARREVESVEADPWLSPLGDLIVDVLNSSALGEASLSYPEQDASGDLGELRLLHGLGAEVDPTPAEAAAYEPGVVCWRFDARVVSSCGLLCHWVDEHDFDHVGIIAAQGSTAEYLDYGSGERSPPTHARVHWVGLRVSDVAVARERSAVPASSMVAIVGGIVTVLFLIVGISWALWPSDDEQREGEAIASGQEAAPTTKAAEQAEPSGPEPVAELVIEGEQAEPESGPGIVRPATGTETGAPEVEAEEAEAETSTVGVWFESERNLGTCKVSFDGRTRTANLHLKTRAPEGKLEFSYRCGQYRGRGSIDVKRNRVNGVLFCKKNGSVKVKTVRSNEGRCDR